MSSVPQGAFATLKAKQSIMKMKKNVREQTKFFDRFLFNQMGFEQPLLQYNSKLMNSIWGLYNRYSVHNFKQIGASGNFKVNFPRRHHIGNL